MTSTIAHYAIASKVVTALTPAVQNLKTSKWLALCDNKQMLRCTEAYHKLLNY